jgi:two-component system, OmpR family, phosphate regulon sensor histidine kinase PhoR
MTRALWSFALPRLLAAIAAAVAVGAWIGHIQLALLLTLAGVVVLNYVRLYRLEHWLRKRASMDPPDLPGTWGDVVALIVRIYRRKLFHKRRVLDLFREFRRMATAVPDGIVLLGPEREIVWFNRNAARLLGLRRKVDFGQRIDNLVRYPDFIRYVAAGDFSLPVHQTVGGENPRHLALQIAHYGAGQKLLLVRDVTREVRIEAMRKDFVANASHELRSPLTVIAGYVDALVDEPGLDAYWRMPLEEMRRQTARMQAVVDDLIELSRLESTTAEAGDDLVDVPAILSLIKRDIAARPEPTPAFELRLEATAGLRGSESELHSVFANLVGNAVKYTPATGKITARWWVDASGGHFSVQDTGVGIARVHLPRLTERFYRVDPGRARTSGGSGLGLAIVKHALQRHGASLEIDSVEGEGSTFACHFPLRRLAEQGE